MRPSVFLNIICGGVTLPAAPTLNTAAVVAGKRIDGTFTPSATAGVTAHRLYRATSSGGTFTQVGSDLGAAATTWTDTDSGKSADTLYYYIVRAVIGSLESVNSNEASARTDALYDTATEGSDTNITAHAPDVSTGGGNWSEIGTANSFYVHASSDTIRRYNIGTGGEAFYKETGLADCVIRFDLTTGGTSTIMGALVRFVDSNNWWKMLYDDATNFMRIYLNNAGVVTNPASQALTLSAGTYPVIITLSGTGLTFNVNGTVLNHTSSVHQSATKHGGAEISTLLGASIDNYRVNRT